MILNDYIEEYKFVQDELANCKEYFSHAEKLITDYFNGISKATSVYFSSSGGDAEKRTFVGSLTNVISNSFSHVTLLVTTAYDFHGALKLLEVHEFQNDALAHMIQQFIGVSRAAISASNEIIVAQLQGMKTKELLTALIVPLQETIKLYHTLTSLYTQFNHVSVLLLEPLPEEIETNPEYENLYIQSLAPTKDMEQISNSLIELAELFEVVGRLDDARTTNSKNYYLRKVETGSLLTAFVTTVFIVKTIVKLIDYCYPKFIQWKQLYYTDKEAQLKLSTQELDTVKKMLELNPSIKDKDELLQTASARLFKYFKLNPEFKLNDKKYKTNMDVLLLQQKEVPTEE